MELTRTLNSLLLLLGLGACNSDDTAPSAGAPATGGAGGEAGSASGGGDVGGAPSCGDAGGELPSGLTTLQWDDGVAATSLRDQNFEITVEGKTFVLNEESVHEAVRFELTQPSRILGFSVHVAAAPEDPQAQLSVGLYPDFGYNGFDFWAADPLFIGTRCAGDISDDGWLTYVLPTPLEVADPGLVYVAHRAEPGSFVFSFDQSEAEDPSCASFDSCRSALNLPDALPPSYFNGVSFPFQYDYLVRLHIEPLEPTGPASTQFDPLPFEPHARASFGDYDNDGDDDLLTDGPKLWRNDAGVFTDITNEAGLGLLPGSGGVFGDFDNDGCLDLFIFNESYTEPDLLYRNDCAGHFLELTSAAGIVDSQSYETCNAPENTRSPTPAAAWVDLDADGFLDLYLANFICWDKGTTYRDEVWHNRGDGTFESWSEGHGFSALKRAGRGVNPIDLDADGDLDLMVNNYRLQENFYFENDGLGQFEESAKLLGLAGSESDGYYGHTIGTAFGDLDGDGDFDLISANLAHPRFFYFSDKTEVLLQGADGNFSDLQGSFDKPSGGAGLRYQETHSVPALADFDLDGRLDLIITAVYDGRPTDFYWGLGDGSFKLDSYNSGLSTKNGWGVALADTDLDGDTDVFATTLFANHGSRRGNYLQTRVVGNVDANRAGIGATVMLTLGSEQRVDYVQGGTGQGNQNSQTLTFGLGAATTVDELRVRFPGGKLVSYQGPFDVNQRLWLYEDGQVLSGVQNPN